MPQRLSAVIVSMFHVHEADAKIQHYRCVKEEGAVTEAEF